MRKCLIIVLMVCVSVILSTEHWTTVNGVEVSAKNLIIQLTDDYSPLLGWEPPAEISDIPGLDAYLNDRCDDSTRTTINFIPVFSGYESFTSSHWSYDLHKFYLLDVCDPNVETVLSELLNLDEIETVEYNYQIEFFETPNDTHYNEQWAHNNDGEILDNNSNTITVDAGCDMDTDEAWDITPGSEEVVIAIIDSGIDMDHEDLDSNIGIGWDVINDNYYYDYIEGDTPHGTKVAGVAAAVGNNGVGVAGVCRECTIYPVRIWPGQDHVGVATAVDGFEHAADQDDIEGGTDIINMSFGFYAGEVLEEDLILFRNAINRAVDDGITVFAGVGNEDVDPIAFPARFANCIAVGSSSPCFQRKSQNPLSCDGWVGYGSNYGAQMELIAPGVYIYTTMPDTGGDLYKIVGGGTSMASPAAAGIAGLMLSVNPDLTPGQIRSILWSSATDVVNEVLVEDGELFEGYPMEGWDMFSGYGLVNARAALDMVLDDPDFVRLYNKNQQNENIGGRLKLENINAGTELNVFSGSLVPVSFGDLYNVETMLLNHPVYTHINWDGIRTEFYVRRNSFYITPNVDIIAEFDYQYPVTISANNENIPLMIRDPWYINNEGEQTDSFYPVADNLTEDGYYYVFLDQGGDIPNLEYPFYSLQAPEYYATPDFNYVFTSWAGNDHVGISYSTENETSVVFQNSEQHSEITANYNACGNGDVNQDAEVNVLDITRIVDIILGEPPEPTEYELWAADVNCDEAVNILDIQIIINFIIGDPPLGRNNNIDGNAQLFLSGNDELLRSDFQLILSIESDVPVGGLQFDISIDIEGLEFSDMELTAVSSALNLRYNQLAGEDGFMVRTVIYPLDADDFIPAGINNVLILNFESNGLTKGNDQQEFILDNVLVSDCSCKNIYQDENQIEIPNIFALHPAYPNPFNPETTIRFDLSKASSVSLKIYDIRGRIVADLLDGIQLMQAGYHSITWNAGNYSSGIYYVKMTIGDYNETQKMILLK